MVTYAYDYKRTVIRGDSDKFRVTFAKKKVVNGYDEFEPIKIELGKAQILSQNIGDIAFIGYGNGVAKACKVAKILDINPTIRDLIFIKPLDSNIRSDVNPVRSGYYNCDCDWLS